MKKTKIKKENKPVKRKKISDAKIRKLVEIDDLEDLFILLKIFDSMELSKFLAHYKKVKTKKSKSRAYKILKKASTATVIEELKSELLKSYAEQYEELKSIISQKRKKGGDVLIYDMMLMSLPLKMKMFNATSDKKDLLLIKKILTELKSLKKDSN